MTEPTPFALTVFRLSLDHERGRIGHRAAAGIAVRGALLAELARLGLVGGERLALPLAGDPPPDGMLAAVHDAMSGRGALPWRRWFGHVSADVRAAHRRLLELQWWQQDPSGRIVDRDAEVVRALALQIRRELGLPDGGAGSAVPAAALLDAGLRYEPAIVAPLSAAAGLLGDRPRPRAVLRAGRGGRGTALRTGDPVVDVVLSAALAKARGQAGLRFLSG